MATASPVLENYIGPTAEQAFARHLQQHATNYFRGVGQARTRMTHKTVRQNSTLYHFDVTIDQATHEVLVKVPFGRIESKRHTVNGQKQLPDAPRLFPKSTRDVKGRFEYLALTRIHHYFRGRDDPRFGTIRILDFLPEHGALFMEKATDDGLRQVFLKVNRLQRPFARIDLEKAFGNIGAWLRIYHQLPGLDHTQPRSTRRSEFVEGIHKLSDYLAKKGQNPSFLKILRNDLEMAARSVLPARLPLGLGHGDFAPRNMLVDPDCRVTVFDTQSKWLVPIYEDLGRFLLALKASGPQMTSQGLLYSARLLRTYENAFLRGYFGDGPVPLAEIRLFEGLHLLSMWAFLTHHHGLATGAKRLAKRCRMALWSRFAVRYFASIRREILQ